jgi:signal peptidase II
MTPKARYFWPLLLVVFLTDCTTKDLAVAHLMVAVPQELFDSLVRLTLVHNPGTAFGIDLRPFVGDWSRVVLIAMMLMVLAAMFRVYWRTAPRARLLGAALGLVCGGAAGNVFDRVRFPLGVVDFIDVGLQAHRFWIFNVADAAITIGAALLALVLLRENTEPLNPRDAAA